MPNHPRPKISAVHALRAAFLDIVSERKIQSKYRWPAKQEVKERVKARFKDAGRPIPSERQWSRYLREAGLWALPLAPRRPVK
jgi:hypothetical protein